MRVRKVNSALACSFGEKAATCPVVPLFGALKVTATSIIGWEEHQCGICDRTHLAKLLLALVAGVAIGFTVAAKAADTSSIPDVAPGIKAARDKINAGEYEAAVPMLSAVLKEKPADADALNLMGFSLRKIGKTTEALDYYGRALAIEPKHPGANEYLGEPMSS